MLRKFSILLSRGDKDGSLELVKAMLDDGMESIWPERYLYVKDYINTVFNRECCQDKFSEYITNKRIVIMGVAPHEDVTKAQSNTLYARINYFGKESIPLVDCEVPTNIGYYNVEKSTELLSKIDMYGKEVGYIVCKDLADGVSVPNQYEGKVRKAYKSFFGCPYGHPLMIPVMLYDLLHYKTDEIYITHNNFYCSSKSYYSEYKDNFKVENVKSLLIGLSSHDLIGNWILMKTWYDDALYNCDSEMTDIMKLSVFEFGKLVESSFRSQLSCL